MQPPGFLPPKSDVWLTHRTAQTREVSQEDAVPQADVSTACENEQSRKRKRDADESMSPVQRKINALRADLATLVYDDFANRTSFKRYRYSAILHYKL
jgi:hypothetical protein